MTLKHNFVLTWTMNILDLQYNVLRKIRFMWQKLHMLKMYNTF